MKLTDEGSCVQLAPAFVDFHTPCPSTASALLVASPVEKYITAGFDGSWQIDEMARLLNRSFIFCQLGIVERKLVHFHNPPAIPPTKTVLPLGSFKVSTRIAAILPEV